MARLTLESLDRRELLSANLLAGAVPVPPARSILIGVLWPAHDLPRADTVDPNETITIDSNRLTHTWDADLLTAPERAPAGALSVGAGEQLNVALVDGSVRGLNGMGVSGSGALLAFHGTPLTDFGPTILGRQGASLGAGATIIGSTEYLIWFTIDL